MQGYSRQTGLVEPQPDRAWVTPAGKPWEGIQIVGYAGDVAVRLLFKKVILLTLVGF